MKKEIVIIMGCQGSGKSTLVKSYVSQGYYRLNRDELNCSMLQINSKLEQLLNSGITHFVLDNTYPTKESRYGIIQLAKQYNVPIRCIHYTTSIEDAQFNVASRILKSHVFTTPSRKGDSDSSYSTITDLLGPNGNKLFKDIVPSIALYAYKKSFEEPTTNEGFSIIEQIKFVREPFPKDYNNKAIILDYDGTIRDTKSGKKYPTDPNDIVILPNRIETLTKYKQQGYRLLGVSNQSGIEKGDLTEEMARKCFDKTNELLGLDIHVSFCPHHSFPIRCYCRKPLSGLGVNFIHEYKLNPKECVFVGNSTTDKTFAKRCGFQYQDQADFFK